MQHSESKAGRAGFYQGALQMLERELVHAASFVETAVAAHRIDLDGNRPLRLRSSSPELATAWLTGKVPFHFRLPNPQPAPNDTPSYRLTGASVASYRGNPAALVTYGKENEKISLLVASSDSAPVGGGDEVCSADLTFHYRTHDGFKVITWSNHGLSYALVSKVSGSARESGLVCHQNMTDHHTF
jgi:anti-sigma factor RsiW